MRRSMPKYLVACLFVATTAFAIHETGNATEPRRTTRKPSDGILFDVESPVSASATEPRRHSDSKDSALVEPDAPSFNKDLELSGPRGAETPAGPKHGRYCENDLYRAGLPHCLGRFAKPSKDCDHKVGYIGGGSLVRGTGRYLNEGAFAMDYSGHWFQRKTWLLWSHGDRYQGGAGRYQTEGPRILPEK